jgi:hypothetical protein
MKYLTFQFYKFSNFWTHDPKAQQYSIHSYFISAGA